MPPVDQQRADKLLALARTRFDATLSPIEEQVLTHSCGYDDPPAYALTEPGRSATGRPLPGWPGPILRSALLRWLLTDPEATVLLEHRGLRIWNARLTEPLDLTACHVSVSLALRFCLVEAPILLTAADLCDLSIRNSTLHSSLDAAQIRLHRSLEFDDLQAAGALHFDGATIEGDFILSNTSLVSTGKALSMQSATIAGSLKLRPKFQSAGCLHLLGLEVDGLIAMPGAVLNATGDALVLDSAAVRGGVFLHEKFESTGTLRMLGAQIGGQLNCRDASLTVADVSLMLDQAEVRDGVFLSKGFTAGGWIRLHGTKIGGQFNCGGAQLTAPKEALSLNAATVTGGVFLNDGFSCLGIISTRAATIGHELNFDGASIQYLTAQRMNLQGTLLWQRLVNPEQTRMDLTSATIEVLEDDHDSWPKAGKLLVNGLVLKNLIPLQADILHPTGRIAWLNRQPAAALAEPQPWLHLASHLEARGHKRAAKRVLFELRKHQSNANWKGRTLKPLGHRWDLTFARLEEQPLRILISIALCVALGTAVFWPMQSHFAPTSDAAYQKATPVYSLSPLNPILPPPAEPVAYPKFQPIVYALENVLPIVKLGQDDKWAPDARHTATPLYWTLMLMRWFLILAGWAQGVILAAAVSARFRS